MAGHWALAMVWTGRNDVRFFSCFRFNHPFTERVHIPEPFRTPWFNEDQNSIVSKSLPECVNDEFSALGGGYFLEDEAEDYHIEFASLSAGNHGQRIDP